MYQCEKCGKEFENCKAIGGHSVWCGKEKKHSEESKLKMRNFAIEYNKQNPNPFFRKKHSEETRIKMSENHADVSFEKNPNWKGGITDRYTYYHNIAWKKFGSEFCDICGMSIDIHYKNKKRRFDMHCTSEPKDYTIMTKENWMCICTRCHSNIEKEN